MPSVNSMYEGSAKAAHSTNGPDLRGGRRVRRSAIMTSAMTNTTKPMQRTAQGKPWALPSAFLPSVKH